MTTFSRSNRLIPAYILHSRKYRDTSLLVELFTLDRGRVPAVLRGARSGKKKAGTVQPFTPLLVAISGRGELKTVTRLESDTSLHLAGEQLLIGLYANELLVRLLGKFEENPGIFEAYQQLIVYLGSTTDTHARGWIRRFELTVLTELGYGINFQTDAITGEAIQAGICYRYVADEGFHLTQDQLSGQTFPGADLLAIASNTLDNKTLELTVKKIIRAALAQLLGNKPLNSRAMFKQYQALVNKH